MSTLQSVVSQLAVFSHPIPSQPEMGSVEMPDYEFTELREYVRSRYFYPRESFTYITNWKICLLLKEALRYEEYNFTTLSEEFIISEYQSIRLKYKIIS